MTDRSKLVEIEDKLDEQLEEADEEKGFLSNLNKRILDWNGFLTSEGKYICKAEWHAVMIPFGMVSSAYMLPKPLGLLTFLSYLLMNKKGFDLLESDYEGHWNDVMEEYAYAAMSFMITIAYWEYLTVETIDGVGEANQIIARIFLGA